MTGLDDIKQIKKIDRDNMSKHIAEFPEQCEKAAEEAEKIILPDNFKQVERVIICGMGGSAIGGDVALSLLSEQIKIPVVISREYELPAYVDNKTLLISVSYSGETEEIISALSEALKKGAKIIVIAGGGQLAELAKKECLPLYQFHYPAPPRSALGYLMIPILVFLKKLKIISKNNAEIKTAVQFIKEFNRELTPDVPTRDNLAKRLAFSAYDRLPIIVGAGILRAVARRWKTQLNENAKTFSFFEILPELNHNAAEGLRFPKRIKDDAVFFLLESSFNHPRIKKRFEILKELFRKEKIFYEEIMAWGEDVWTEKFSLILLGDWISFYLAILNGINPSPVPTIRWTKEKLKE